MAGDNREQNETSAANRLTMRVILLVLLACSVTAETWQVRAESSDLCETLATAAAAADAFTASSPCR